MISVPYLKFFLLYFTYVKWIQVPKKLPIQATR
jgi:hypothetical protein